MRADKDYIEHHVAHHFDTAEQEFDAAKIGMWAFLATEVLMFGGLFVAYIVFRIWYPEMFAEASSHLNWKLGALNTCFLIISSYTMANGIRMAQLNNRNASIINLSITVFLAGGFMIVKYFEYMEKIHHGYLPAGLFTGEGVHDTLHIFFSLYFIMTGIHGIHVVIGMGLIIWLIIRSIKKEFYSEFYTPIELVGLFWHVVDLIWIFLFPLLYLI
jgi:cytochrome c oxidase subunit III